MGWIPTPVVPDSKCVYVSTSGSDTNNGLTPATAVKTLAHAATLMKPGDRMCLKKGDIFKEGPLIWKWPGVPGAYAGLFAYGTGPRPKLINPQGGIRIYDRGIHDVAFDGICVENTTRNPSSPDFINNFTDNSGSGGIILGIPCNNILLQDLDLCYHMDNLTLTAGGNSGGPLTNITVNRCVIHHAWSTAMFGGQGVYAQDVDGLTITENVFDHNGWVADIQASMYRHNMYLNETNLHNVTVDGNIVARGSGFGVQMRTDGRVTNNFFFDNAVHGLIGGTKSQFTTNVVVAGHNTTQYPLKAGVSIIGLECLCDSNLFLDQDDPNTKYPNAAISTSQREWTPAGTKNAVITNNTVYNWTGGAVTIGDAWDAVTIQGNNFQHMPREIILAHVPIKTLTVGNNKWTAVEGNKYQLFNFGTNTTQGMGTAQAVTFPNPSMWLPAGFLDRAIQQSRDNWDDNYTAAALNKQFLAAFTPGGAAPKQLTSVTVYFSDGTSQVIT